MITPVQTPLMFNYILLLYMITKYNLVYFFLFAKQPANKNGFALKT